MPLNRPLPELDGAAGEFWKGAANGKLLIQRCGNCGGYQHYARAICLKCQSESLEMVPSSGKGTIYSFTVVYRGPYEDIATPYTVALIRLAEGVVILSQIADVDPAELKCDLDVQLSFQSLADGVKLPVFRVVRAQ